MARKKRGIKNKIFIFITFAFFVAIAGMTYSRYMGTATVNANAQIAKWSIKLNAEDISVQSKTVDIKAVDEVPNENVSNGKLAPGKTMKAQIEVNPEGSEVAIDYTFKIDTSKLEIESNSDIKPNLVIERVECKIESDEGEKVRSLLLDDDGTARYFESLDDVLKNRKVTFVAYITWNDENNTLDTQSGMNIKSIKAPVEVTAKQHMGQDVEVGAESLEFSLDSLNNGETLTLSENIDFTEKYAQGAGKVLMFPDNSTLNLNGSTISSNNMGVIYSGNNFKIQNGGFTTEGSYGIFVGSNSTSNNVTLEQVQSEGGINVFNAKGVVLKDVDVTAHKYYAVWGDENSEITINSGIYRTSSNSTALFGRSASGNVREGFKINGGTFITNGKKFCLEGNYLPPVIYGGTFDCDVSKYVASGYEAKQIDETTWVVEKV